MISFNDLAPTHGPSFVTFPSQNLCSSIQTFTVPQKDPHFATLRRVMHDGKYEGGRNWLVNHRSQIITKWRLLERLAKSLECLPPNSALQKRSPATSLASVPGRLKKAALSSKGWLKACKTIKDNLQSLTEKDAARFDADMPPDLSSDQVAHQRGVDLLVGSYKSSLESAYHAAKANLQMVAFLVQWHAAVSRFIHQLLSTNGIESRSAQHSIAP